MPWKYVIESLQYSALKRNSCVIFRRESLDELPIAFTPSVFFFQVLSLWQLRCSLYDFFSNLTHNVEQKILRPMA